jgi:hypothetical protein
MTQPTLDSRDWARPSSEQDDRFREVQVAARTGRWGPETELLKVAAMRLARENGKVEVDTVVMKPHRGVLREYTRFRGGFTAPEMVEEAELVGKVPSWLAGAVCGWLSDQGQIRVGCNGTARENSSNGTRKGSKVNRWELAPQAVREPPEPTLPEIPSGR